MRRKPIQEAEVRRRDAVLASLERWDAEWDEMEMTSEEIIDAGEHLIKAILFRGRGRGSGVEVEGRFFQVHTVEDGRTVRWEELGKLRRPGRCEELVRGPR